MPWARLRLPEKAVISLQAYWVDTQLRGLPPGSQGPSWAMEQARAPWALHGGARPRRPTPARALGALAWVGLHSRGEFFKFMSPIGYPWGPIWCPLIQSSLFLHISFIRLSDFSYINAFCCFSAIVDIIIEQIEFMPCKFTLRFSI